MKNHGAILGTLLVNHMENAILDEIKSLDGQKSNFILLSIFIMVEILPQNKPRH